MLVKPNKIREELTKLDYLGLDDDLFVIALGTFKEMIQTQIDVIRDVKLNGKVSINKSIYLSEMIAEYRLLLMTVEDKIKAKGGQVS